jgi:AcrR family transcriptional regulator
VELATRADDSAGSRVRRPYDSPVRQQRMRQTRERIVDAGVEAVRGLSTWDWTMVTFRAVAEGAGVGERTVYRHFPTERDLRDAIMGRLAETAGVNYEDVTLSSLAEVAGRVFRSLGTFAVAATPLPPGDPTFAAVDDQRRQALLRAVAADDSDLSERHQVIIAAVLDVLWSVASYERLVTAWGMDPDDAIDAIGWAIDVVAGGGGAGGRGSRKHRSTS